MKRHPVNVDASAITDISGDYTDIVDLYNSGVSVTGLGDEAITIQMS